MDKHKLQQATKQNSENGLTVLHKNPLKALTLENLPKFMAEISNLENITTCSDNKYYTWCNTHLS